MSRCRSFFQIFRTALAVMFCREVHSKLSDNVRFKGGKDFCSEVHLAADNTEKSEHTVTISQREHDEICSNLEQTTTIKMSRRTFCPAHDSYLLPTESQNFFIRWLVRFLKVIVSAVLTVCPPWPPWIFRKIVYRAPGKGFYYHLIGGPKDKRRIYYSAALAKDQQNLRVCLPHLQDSRVKAVDIYYHLMRTTPLILDVDSTHICVMELLCEKTTQLNTISTEKVRSPTLVIFCQPNSSDIGSCMLMDPNFADIADFFRSDMLVFDYPGYGVSDGKTTETSIHAAVERVYKYATTMLGYAPKDIILMGFSLGTAAAVHMASMVPELGALVLVAPLTSICRVILGRSEAESTCRFDLYRSYDKAGMIKCPTLICHGEEDIIIGDRHGRAMHKRIAGSELYLMKTSHQGILCERQMWDRAEKFITGKMDIDRRWAEHLSRLGQDEGEEQREVKEEKKDELEEKREEKDETLAEKIDQQEKKAGTAEKKDGTEEKKEGAEEKKTGMEVKKEEIQEKKAGTEEKKEGTEKKKDGTEEKKDGAEERKE